jgi:hypothetical protein
VKFSPWGELGTQGWIWFPRGIVHPFRDCSPLHLPPRVNTHQCLEEWRVRGDNFTPRGKSSPLGANFIPGGPISFKTGLLSSPRNVGALAVWPGVLWKIAQFCPKSPKMESNKKRGLLPEEIIDPKLAPAEQWELIILPNLVTPGDCRHCALTTEQGYWACLAHKTKQFHT